MSQWAVITGASSGIGLSIARLLAEKSYHLLLVGRNEERLNKLSEELNTRYQVQAAAFVADLGTDEGIAALENKIQSIGTSIEVLVNNAGIGIWGKFAEIDWKRQAQMLMLNNTALLALTHSVLPYLLKNKKGYILNIGSTASFQAVPGMAVYSASKGFVVQFSRGLHEELTGTGVQVTCVNPGATETAFVERAGMQGSSLEKQAEKFNMSPDEVARIAVDAMFNQKNVVTTGLLNQLNYVASRILPKKILEKGAASLYLKDLK